MPSGMILLSSFFSVEIFLIILYTARFTFLFTFLLDFFLSAVCNCMPPLDLLRVIEYNFYYVIDSPCTLTVYSFA